MIFFTNSTRRLLWINKNSIFHDRLNHNKITFTFIDSETTFHYKRAMWFLKFTSLAKVTQTADELYTLRNYAWLLRRCSKLLRLHNDSPHSFLRIQSLCHKKNPPIYPNLHQLKECFSQTCHVKMTLGDVSWKSVEILCLIILGI